MIPDPWLTPAAAALSRQRATLPNAMLLYGPRGAGGFELAYEFAKSLLCHHPGPEGEPCGHCRGCELTRAGTHPDLRVIVPEYFAVAKDLPFAQPESSSSTRKTLSREILLPQVKALGDFLELTANQGGRRIVVIYPAEMVRAEAAAALLKSIEEPPSKCTFLLVTEELDAVLPTIRSRSRLFRLTLPSKDEALAWLKEKGVDEAERRLALAGGSPLLALEDVSGLTLPEEDEKALLNLLRRGAALTPDDIVRGVTKGLTVPAVLYYFTRWATDLVRVKSGLEPLFFPLEANTLARQASGASEEKLIALYDDLLERNRHSEHPLNVKNVTEALCLHLVVALS